MDYAGIIVIIKKKIRTTHVSANAPWDKSEWQHAFGKNSRLLHDFFRHKSAVLHLVMMLFWIFKKWHHGRCNTALFWREASCIKRGVFTFVCTPCVCVRLWNDIWSVSSSKIWVSFAEYSLFYRACLQKSHMCLHQICMQKSACILGKARFDTGLSPLPKNESFTCAVWHESSRLVGSFKL